MDGHTNTHIYFLSLWFCCGRLKWPLWAELNISVHSGSASECRLLPQPRAWAANQLPWTPAKLLTPPWVVLLHAAPAAWIAPTSSPRWSHLPHQTAFLMWNSTEHPRTFQLYFYHWEADALNLKKQKNKVFKHELLSFKVKHHWRNAYWHFSCQSFRLLFWKMMALKSSWSNLENIMCNLMRLCKISLLLWRTLSCNQIQI